MNIFLLANGRVGLEVARHLVESGDTVTHLYLHPEGSRSLGNEIIEAAQVDPVHIFPAQCTKDEAHIRKAPDTRPDFIMTVYLAYLLRPSFYSLARNILNFHPALLPVNRGWYPHVHSILDGTPCGVTLPKNTGGSSLGLWFSGGCPFIWCYRLISRFRGRPLADGGWRNATRIGVMDSALRLV